MTGTDLGLNDGLIPAYQSQKDAVLKCFLLISATNSEFSQRIVSRRRFVRPAWPYTVYASGLELQAINVQKDRRPD